MKEKRNYPVSPDTPVPKRPLGQKLLAVALILAVLVSGVLLARYLVQNKPKAKRRLPKKMETLVRVTPVKKQDVQLVIPAMGTVTATVLDLKPRISGTVVALHPNFIQGGLIKKGEVLLELDDTDYRLALQRAKNNLHKAAMDVRIEEGGQAVARREFELIREFSGSSLEEAPQDLVLREPQIAKARSAEATARAELQKAELDLGRTKLSAPFDCLILDKNIAIGGQVNSQTTVARLAESDIYYVQVGVPRSYLDNFSLPGSENQGAEVQVIPAGESGIEKGPEWQGVVYSLLGKVEAGSLMAQFLVRIDDPMGQNPGHRLLLDSPVEILIQGKSVSSCFKLPRKAVRPDNTVLLAADDNTLLIRSIEVVWRDPEWIYAVKGLEDGNRLITTPVSAPVSGMALRIAGSGRKKPGHAGIKNIRKQDERRQ